MKSTALQSQIRKDKNVSSKGAKKYSVIVYGSKLMTWRKHGTSDKITDYSTGVIYHATLKNKDEAIRKAKQWQKDTRTKAVTVEELDESKKYSITSRPTYLSGTGIASRSGSTTTQYRDRKIVYEHGSRW